MGFLSRLRVSLLPVALLLTLLCASQPVRAEEAAIVASGDQLCALIVQRLVKYVFWPAAEAPERTAPFLLAATNAREIRPYFADPAAASGMLLSQWPVASCHILLLNGTAQREAAAIVARLADRPVLTVGYKLDTPPPGLIVNIVEWDGRLKLQIDMQAARNAGLVISSRLLQLAQVHDGVSRD